MSSLTAALVVIARDLLERDDPNTAGIWPRASALLTRQALEAAMDDLWQLRAPGVERCSARAQFICLPAYLPGSEDLAERVYYTWSGLSRACHQHPYELPPTFSELNGWLETVQEFGQKVSSILASAKKD